MAPVKKNSKKVVKKAPKKADPLYPSTPRSFRIGGAIRPKNRDLTRMLKWPRYIRIQRQRKILNQRLKVPPVINQFKNTVEKNQACELFKLLSKYQPETKAEKAERLGKLAEAGKTTGDGPVDVIKFGLQHVTTLVESKKAKLVVIAHNVDPIELVLWLPALCRKMEVPYCIVKDKARLGALVHQKNATCLAITNVGKDDAHKLKSLADSFTEKYSVIDRKWGGGKMGHKTETKLRIRKELVEKELAKKLAL